MQNRSSRIIRLEFTQALTYSFQDEGWVRKWLILIAFACCVVLFPFSLFFLSIVLGYEIHISDRVRFQQTPPLPEWDQIPQMFVDGAHALVAGFIYQLPLLILYGISYLLLVMGRGQYSPLALVLLCVLVPFGIVYAALSWSLMAAAITEFNETKDHSVYYQFSSLVNTLKENSSITWAYIINMFTINILLTFLLFIPILGWLVYPAFQICSQGHLIGQFGHIITRDRA
ncbi:hypothetical protein MASR2M15_00920 [Anaerolineales bacterium]